MLGRFPLLEGTSASLMQAIAAITQVRTYGRYEQIYDLDAAPLDVYFLLKGTVKIGMHFSDGREVIKQILSPLTMFGEMGLSGQEKRRDFAVAMNEEVTLMAIPAAELKAIILRDPGLSMRLLTLVGNRLQRLENRLESLIFKDARERIIDFLKDSACRQGRKVGFETLIRHSLTQQDIANLTGTSRQTVTSVLNDLRRANLIHFNRRSILIRDMNKLS